MVPALSLSEKPKVGCFSILALFVSETPSSDDNRATNITLEGQDPVLPRAAKMTLIVPKGGPKVAFFLEFEFVWALWPLE